MAEFFENCGEEQSDVSKQNAESQQAAESNPKRKDRSSSTTFVTVLLSVCLFITSLLAVVIFDVRNAVKADNVERIIKDVKATDLLDASDSDEDNGSENLYGYIERNFNVDINEEAVDEFFSKSTIDEYVAHQIAEFGEDFFDGEAKLVIKKNELVDVLNENLEVFESELGIHLTSQETRGIVDYIIDGDEVCVVTTDDIKHSNSALYYAFNIGFSYITMGIFIFLSAFIILFMILNSFTQSTCGMGVVFVILGGLTSLSAMLAEWIYPLWEAIFNGSVIGALSGGFVVVNASIGVILLVLGVAMLVTHIILKKHRKENPTAV